MMISIVKWIFKLIRKYGFRLYIFGTGLFILVLIIDNLEFEATLLSFFYFTSLAIVGTRWLIKEIKLINQLKNEKAKTELMHLKSQVNPHFFFNMLNNLYGLVDKDSQKAKELILRLSDMMQYSIYEGQRDFSTLEEEVEYLTNYIELHKMRYHKKIEVLFSTTILEEGYKVMPLLFIILLENAFKHGAENLTNKAYIYVELVADNSGINFTVENNFDVSGQLEKPGIGLKNLQRRLELAYPNTHSLSYSITENVYKTELMLQQL